MKRIEAVFQAGRFGEVREKLEQAGCLEALVFEVGESGRPQGTAFSWKNWPAQRDPFGRVQLEIVAAPDFVMSVVRAILEGASKNGMDRGKIMVSDAEDIHPIWV